MQTSTNNTMEWFKTVPFSDVVLWDVKRYSFEKIKSQYPIVKLGLHIQEESHKVKLADFPEEEFGILGVNNKTGIFDAYKEKGTNINQAYKKMEKGWLAYNPYRVNVGSIGLRTEEHENEYISPAYVVFSCKETLLPDFLFKLFKTERFNKVINASTTGSVRQNLTIDILKSLDIPLPPIEVQKSLIKKYNEFVNKSKVALEQSDSNFQNADDFIYRELNLKLLRKESSKGLSFVRSKDITRWDVSFLDNLITLETKTKTINLGLCISEFNYDKKGSSLRFESKNFPESQFKYIGMENILKNNGQLEEFQIVNGEEIKSQTFQVPKGYILYGKLRPYLNKYWINHTDFDDIICSSEFFVFDLNENIVNKDYFISILGSSIIQKQIENNSTGARMPRINEQTFRELKIPLPDLKKQKELAGKIKSLESAALSLIDESEDYLKQSIKEFENNVFLL
tara:strand:+ start:260669 stop:262030 length:1362 start_codon:yes stop_codon:yes gene_type:complete